MQLFFLPHLNPEAIQAQKIEFTFDENESRHIAKSMRLKPGDVLNITDGAGFLYKGVIEEADQRQTRVWISEPHADKRLLTNKLHIAIAPTKNPDRIEWFVEKATEMGVDEISLLSCEHSERSRLKTERLERIAIAALKQSGRSRLPLLHETVDFERFLQQKYAGEKYIAWCETDVEEHLLHKIKKGTDVIVLIGPEGDFSKEEADAAIAAGYQPVSLGRFTLRTETAGLTACMLFHQANLE
ncbi:MAG TPA: 16S rRNA (uracil(1498)-N(3))-methyltransferase [Bacteroidales bacterium]|nr:MAG: 16S rRNA (uracil(1498)-N(3))-methyltransferase [Bacteroidetes bacterium GWE2_42_24]OFY25168.1 MAG: 16S rRNA (uracil(1498)-N(3))-methyltransferase [Bacteroidetes bacterium GWF2_43_11]PKP17010.1 MAG: 16S rRNA (uracil(1498)-N(3))-methyltransferase [Bacteroidetes bacterium HGW-Bacteroidetes-22]HBZ66295.1 16S rRNA (uracil(1498)-N(3))-methyltransferase [Bacteroidales bacterium]